MRHQQNGAVNPITWGTVYDGVADQVSNSELSPSSQSLVRALLNFAGEEAKHIHLFKRFHAAFVRGFPVEPQLIGPSEAIGAEVLRHDPLAVGERGVSDGLEVFVRRGVDRLVVERGDDITGAKPGPKVAGVSLLGDERRAAKVYPLLQRSM